MITQLLVTIAELFGVYFVLISVLSWAIVARGGERLYGVPVTPQFYTRAEAEAIFRRQGCDEAQVTRLLAEWKVA